MLIMNYSAIIIILTYQHDTPITTIATTTMKKVIVDPMTLKIITDELTAVEESAATQTLIPLGTTIEK